MHCKRQDLRAGLCQPLIE